MAFQTAVNRREVERIVVNRPVEVTTSRGASDYFDGTLMDYSDKGLRFFTRRLLSKGERVTVHWGQRRLVGIVVYCNSEQNGLIVGLQRIQ
jgi:PilZ domain